MAYRVKSRQAPEAEITRILQKQVGRARAAIRSSSASPAERARKARVATKKIRAILRLACPHDLNTAKHPERLFRDAARTLSDVREAGAVLGTLERLQSEASGKVDGRSLYVARRALTTVAAGEPAGDSDVTAAFKAFSRALDRGLSRVRNGSLLHVGKSKAFDWAAEGFEIGYAQARRSFKRALHTPSAAALHTWRKRTKTHAFHCALLSTASPAKMQPWQEALQQLGASLGYERDLGLLRERICESLTAHEESAGRVQSLLTWIEQRRATLRKEAFNLGEHLFAEKPKAVTRRVAAWWQATQ